MEILKILKFLLKYIDLFIAYTGEFWYRFGCVAFILFVYLVGCYVISAFQDNGKFLPIYAGIINSVHKTNDVKLLFKQIQENIDSKVNYGRDMRRYIEVGRSADGFVKDFLYSMAGAVFCMMIFGPALVDLFHYEYIKGTLTVDILNLPIDSIFPYNYKGSCVSLYLLAFAVSSIDGFFMGVTFNVVGCLRDLMEMVSEIDNVLTKIYHLIILWSTVFRHEKQYEVKQINPDYRAETLKRIINSVECSNKIFYFIKVLEKAASPIIVGQHHISLAELCTLAFNMFTNKKATAERLFVLIVCLSELYIYCNCGKELTVSTENVGESIFNIHWYHYPPNIRTCKYYVRMVMRTHKPTDVEGAKMLTRSLESIKSALNLVTILHQAVTD